MIPAPFILGGIIVGPIIFLAISMMASKRVKSGQYWVYSWFFMGIIVALAIVEWSSYYLSGRREIVVTDFLSYRVLWVTGFIGLLLGFIPRFIPQIRKDSLYLGIYVFSWTGFMFCVHLVWVGFMIMLGSLVP